MPKREYGKEERTNLREVLDSRRLSVLAGGTMAGRFERAFAKAQGAKYGVAMNCAMSALHASLIAAGVQDGDEVLCDPVCVFGALAVLYQRARPVFVDCRPVTFNMDPDRIEENITRRTKAIIVTHVGGLPAEIDRIVRIARAHGLFVIEDYAHAFEATYKGRYAGTWGDVGVFSFQASKQLSTGDGGMAITNKRKTAAALALHAGAPTFLAVAHGVHYNYRMNEMTAAVGLAQIPKVRKACRELAKIGRLWDAAIEGCPWLVAQKGPPHAQSTYHLWLATFEEERANISLARFRKALEEYGTGCSVGYTGLAAYQHPVFEQVFRKGAYPKGLCPCAERTVPRMIMGYTMVPMGEARRIAGAWRRLVKELS